MNWMATDVYMSYLILVCSDNHRIGNKKKGNSAVQHVALFLCSLLVRIMAEQPVQRFYWPENAIDWPEPA